MKFEKLNFGVAAVLLVFAFGYAPLCDAETASDKTSIQEIKKETQDLLKVLKEYSIDQRDEAIKKSKAALDNLDKRIDALETRIENNWDKMNTTARENARASLKSLRQQRIEVAEWYGGLKNSSDDAWKHMKKGFSKAYTAVNDAWAKAEKEFESDK